MAPNAPWEWTIEMTAGDVRGTSLGTEMVRVCPTLSAPLRGLSRWVGLRDKEGGGWGATTMLFLASSEAKAVGLWLSVDFPVRQTLPPPRPQVRS